MPRKYAALQLYLKIGLCSKIAMPADSFPARFSFDDTVMRPDKGVIKVLLEEGIVEAGHMGAQLIFSLTPAGLAFMCSQPFPTSK